MKWGRTTAALAKSVAVNLSAANSPLPVDLTLSTNRFARLAPSSTLLQCGHATILATATPHHQLAIHFRSKAAAVGVIPLTWTRREQQPAIRETLTARLIDRSLRPTTSFAHLCVNVFAARRACDPPLDALAVNAAAAATAGLPNWTGPVAAARVSYIDGKFVPFASESLAATSHLSVFVAINQQHRILCLSIEAQNKPQPLVNDAIAEAITAAAPILALQQDYHHMLHQLREQHGLSSFPRQTPEQPNQAQVEQLPDESVIHQIKQSATDLYTQAFLQCTHHPGKAHRAHVLTKAQQQLLHHYNQYSVPHVLQAANVAVRRVFRSFIFDKRLRLDGRNPSQIRPLRAEASVLSGDVHGSAIFERGDTQVLAHATIGHLARAAKVEEYIDTAEQRPFFVHYSFPPYAIGDIGNPSGPSNRREVGHGALAEAAIAPMLDSSPYALRVSTEVLASDGSSSMAAVCAGSMALRDAGAPLTEDVAGVAMGLVTDGDREIILTDILGAEDHFGEMDMKVAGTNSGITACQLDTKLPTGLSQDTIANAFKQASEAHAHILDHMAGQQDRAMPKHAPRVVELPMESSVAARILLKDRALLLRDIGDQTNTKLWYDGRKQVVSIEAPNEEAAQEASRLITEALVDLEIGTKLTTTVLDVRSSFALVQTDDAVQGVLHVSKMMVNPINGSERFPDARRLLAKGDKLEVVVLESDRTRNILRFGLTKPPRRTAELESAVDDFLAAVATNAKSQEGP
ncbi:Polyribonucleotide nucleotidyltransferase [Gracilariopsis chorda]|uniref:polyribonucleotide nucleotidyltransferase n=1 Tax=Gracilariopsis chorda TaxID=448386 RepID=A0A2V3J446_9FLOR|nr:Polyribonucleotide nucleotidyltransferase [Gracilariopsis chorda]|eukprot:PXF49188.1 Polyribonucleotide nucleotidyltransferase [Gracilariopsis chorda]